MNELNLDGMALAPGVVETIVSIAANEVEDLRQAVADAVASQVGAQVSSVDVYIDGIQFAG